ncbi:MAG: HU family DNA-binding protein [Tannerellaceae bacterium]|jgi:predicted histone-like DNA-binding protein|nr:HU family DNA-binding protein [Tannerellaceae bacterium]
MPLEYDFYENPAPEGSGREKRLHARAITRSTMNTDEIAEQIHEMSTLTTSDVKGVLVSLVGLMEKELASGRRIHIEGLGFFQLTLSCPPVSSEKEIRAESINVKSIVFRPEAGFKDHFRAVSLVRAKQKSHSKRHSEAEIDHLLTRYFAENEFLSSARFQMLFGLTKSTSARRIQQLLAAGKLRKVGLSGHPLYEPAPGWYQKEK